MNAVERANRRYEYNSLYNNYQHHLHLSKTTDDSKKHYHDLLAFMYKFALEEMKETYGL